MAFMCCGSGGDVDEMDPELARINAEAKRQLNREKEVDLKIIKMLLLGAGESGKSTIFKQMKVINGSGYSEKEKKGFVGIVFSNTIQSMVTLLQAFERLGIDMPADLQVLCDEFHAVRGPELLDPGIGQMIKQIWEHASVQEIFERKSEYQLNDSADYYFNRVVTLSAPGYIPSEQDVLRSRVRTTGIVQSEFTINAIKFLMFDVGGQRNERRKWIHAFDDVNAMIFVASLSEYDQVLFEDETINRMDEAISLFEQLVNSKWFRKTAVILFLNKSDLFEMKLKKKPLKQFYKKAVGSDITDDTDPRQCGEFFKGLFRQKSKNPDKSIFVHITCATDTGNVRFVFDAVIASILAENLKESGLA